MQIILYQPQIPQNTGNIVRTCSVTGSSLRLIPPLGFQITDRWLRRAGLDYCEGVDVQEAPDLLELLESSPAPFYFFSSHATLNYSDVTFTPDSRLVFGSETQGLPDWIFERWPDRCLRLPMRQESRCLNLASSVAIGVYEAWRQNNFCFDFDLKA